MYARGHSTSHPSPLFSAQYRIQPTYLRFGVPLSRGCCKHERASTHARSATTHFYNYSTPSSVGNSGTATAELRHKANRSENTGRLNHKSRQAEQPWMQAAYNQHWQLDICISPRKYTRAQSLLLISMSDVKAARVWHAKRPLVLAHLPSRRSRLVSARLTLTQRIPSFRA